MSMINKLFSDENQVPEHCVELERWQGQTWTFDDF